MDTDALLELVRVLAAFAHRDSDLARTAQERADDLLGECRWCRLGYPLTSMNPDVHVPTLNGGGAYRCERATALARTLWA